MVQACWLYWLIVGSEKEVQRHMCTKFLFPNILRLLRDVLPPLLNWLVWRQRELDFLSRQKEMNSQQSIAETSVWGKIRLLCCLCSGCFLSLCQHPPPSKGIVSYLPHLMMFVILFLLYASFSSDTQKIWSNQQLFYFCHNFFYFFLPFSWCSVCDLISTQDHHISVYKYIVFAIFPDLFVTFTEIYFFVSFEPYNSFSFCIKTSD